MAENARTKTKIPAAKIVRRVLDVFSVYGINAFVLLMGGITAFENLAVHEWLGAALIAMWIFHNVLNRGFYRSLFRGKYNAARIVMVSVNGALLVCVALLAASEIMLSNSVFTFLKIHGGMAFARTAHLVASHWYYILVALHFALHAGTVFGNIPATKDSLHPVAAKIFRAVPVVFSVYGIYAFVLRGYYKYLFNIQPFFFFDIERGFSLFVLDYFSIFVLAATCFYYILKFSLKKKAGEKSRRIFPA